MIYRQIHISFRDDENVKTATFNQASFRVEGGILFIYKEDVFSSLSSNVPVFTIKEERVLFLTVKAEAKNKNEKSVD